MVDHSQHESFWNTAFRQFSRRRIGMAALFVLAFFVLVGVYAPFLASSQPLVVRYDGQWYFPLFRYLFFSGFFTTRLDIFFNLLIFTLPLVVAAFWLSPRNRFWAWMAICVAQAGIFAAILLMPESDPAADSQLTQARVDAVQTGTIPTWKFELDHMNSYAQLELVLRYRQRIAQHERLLPYEKQFAAHILQRGDASNGLPTLWRAEQTHEKAKLERLRQAIQSVQADSPEAIRLRAELQLIKERRQWLVEQNQKLSFVVMPLLRPYHWEDDVGGEQALNQYVPWWELTRTDRKDLSAALIFGVRISLVVGITAVLLALLIGIPLGCLAGYYGGTTDIILCRLMEIWEAMPTFFMLLLVVAVTQSKSIFLVIAIIGFFGWTGFSRYVRGEFFKQRGLSYVEACYAQGFSDSYIIYRHILPNAIPPLLTLLPFAVMGAISTEAGLSFLGLGEEGSCSWGVLMDEGRRAFPGESYLLWPPAILLTVLLVAIALVGDALRDAIDPRLHVH
jgi:peptide/nickel transport system permease protein